MNQKKQNGLIGLIIRCYGNDILRYLFFGGVTTLLNIVVFYGLRKLGVNLNVANFISIVCAVLFAYVVNSLFVFHDKCETLKDHIRPFFKFIGARLITMGVEMGGVSLIVEKMGNPDMVGKVITQVIVVILNYIFSKFLVFTGKKEGSKRE